MLIDGRMVFVLFGIAILCMLPDVVRELRETIPEYYAAFKKRMWQ